MTAGVVERPAATRGRGAHRAGSRFRTRTPRAGWPSTMLLAVGLAYGIGLRAALIGTSYTQLNSDTAVSYLMSKHVSHGEFTTFFWGSEYAGTLLQMTAGGAFHVVGTSVAAYQAINAVWWFAAALLFRQLVRALWNPVAGDLTAVLLWIGTPELVTLSLRDPAYYGPTLVLAATILLVATRRDVRPVPVAAAVGVLTGLELWTSPNGMAFAIPPLILFAARTRTLRSWYVAFLGAFAGALPWLAWNAGNGWRSVTEDRSPWSQVAPRAWDLFTVVIPSAVPGYQYESQHVIVAAVAIATLAGGLVVALVRRRWDRLTVGATAITGTLVIAGAIQGVDASARRYATFLAPIIIAFLLAAITAVPRWGRLLAGLATSAAVGVCSVTIWWDSNHLEPNHGNYWTGSVPALTTYLDAHHIDAAFADYWIAYEVVAQSDERIVVDALGQDRRRSYAAIAEGAPRATVIAFTGQPDEKALLDDRRLPPYTIDHVAEYTVFRFDRPLARSVIPVPPPL